MLSAIIYILIGMFIAWFFFPAPQVARDLRDWVISKIPALAPFARKDDQ